METVGFVGLGKMGTPMAVNIRKAGYPMVVYDISEVATKPLLEEGARLAGSPSEVARASEILFTSLPRPQVVERVVKGPEGILEGIQKGAIYLDMSTCGPDTIRGLEPLLQEKGAHVMDTPVLSSPLDAIERGVILMVGGEKGIFDRLHPLFDVFSDKVIYTGGLGTACICKVVHNMTTATVLQAVAEGLTLGMKAGVKLPILLESGTKSAIGSLTPRLSRTVFQGRFEPPDFTLDLGRKDLGLATELGRRNDVPLPVGSLVEQLMMQAMNRGWGEKDRTVAVVLQEETAGVEIRLA